MVDYNYLYNKEFYKKYTDKNNKVDKELSYHILKNAYALPSRLVDDSLKCGLLDCERNYIETSAVHSFCKWSGGAYEFDMAKCEKCDETVIYLGAFYEVWGHCLTDNLRRLWFLKTQLYKSKYRNCKLVYVPVGGFKFGSNFERLLSIMGFEINQFVPIYDLVQFQEVIYPDECFYNDEFGNRFYTQEYQDLIDEVRNYACLHVKDTGFEKVYFTCSQYSSSKQFGEYRLEKFFSTLGYKIIAPENYTLDEQLNILQNCKYFAATIGSAAHNIIFLNRGTSVVLIPRADYLTGYQIALNHVQELDVTFVDASLSVVANRRTISDGPFYYYISDKLLEYFNIKIKKDEKYWKYNSKGFVFYLLYGMVKNYQNSGCCVSYYSEELQKYILGGLHTSYLYKVIKKLKIMQILMKIKLLFGMKN